MSEKPQIFKPSRSLFKITRKQRQLKVFQTSVPKHETNIDTSSFPYIDSNKHLEHIKNSNSFFSSVSRLWADWRRGLSRSGKQNMLVFFLVFLNHVLERVEFLVPMWCCASLWEKNNACSLLEHVRLVCVGKALSTYMYICLYVSCANVCFFFKIIIIHNTWETHVGSWCRISVMVSINFTPTSRTLGQVHEWGFGHVAAVFFSNLVVRCFLLFLCPFTFGSAAFVSLWVLLSFLCGGGSENCSTVYVLRVFLQPARAGWVRGRGGWVVWLFCEILCFRRFFVYFAVFTLQDKVQGRVNDFEDGPWCGLYLVSGWRTFGMVSCCEWVFEVWDAPRDQQPTSHRLHAVHGFRPSLNAILCMSHHTTMNFVQVRNWQGPPRCYTSHPERMSFGTRLASRHFIHFMHSTMRDVVKICPHVKLDNHQVPDVVRLIQCFLNRQVRSLKSTCCQPSLDFGRFDVLWRTNSPAM